MEIKLVITRDDVGHSITILSNLNRGDVLYSYIYSTHPGQPTGPNPPPEVTRFGKLL